MAVGVGGGRVELDSELVVHPGAFVVRVGHCTVLGWKGMGQWLDGGQHLRAAIEAPVGRLAGG